MKLKVTTSQLLLLAQNNKNLRALMPRYNLISAFVKRQLLYLKFVLNCHCRFLSVPKHYTYPKLLFTLKKNIFKSSFIFTGKLRGKYRDFPFIPYSCTCIAYPTINNSPKKLHLLLSMNPHWNIVIIQSPLELVGCHVYSVGFDKCIRAHIYCIIRSGFAALKIFCALCIHP